MTSRSVLIRTMYRAEAGLLGWSPIGAQAVQARGRVPALAAVSGPAVGLVVVDRSLFDTCRAETYRCQRTDRYTGAAINAFGGIDVQLRHFIERRAAIVIGSTLRRMNTIHRAHIHAGGVLGSNAGFGDDVGHRSPPCAARLDTLRLRARRWHSRCR